MVGWWNQDNLERVLKDEREYEEKQRVSLACAFAFGLNFLV